MLNHAILEGRLGRDPDIFITQKGRQLATFSLATSSTWKEETGEWQTKVYWHEIVVYRDSTIRWLKDILKQGDLVHVEGRLTYHSFEDSHNQKRRKAQVVVSEHFGKVERIIDQKQKSKPLLEKIEFVTDSPESDDVPDKSDSDKSDSDTSDSDSHPLENIPFLFPQSQGQASQGQVPQGRAPQHHEGENSCNILTLPC